MERAATAQAEQGGDDFVSAPQRRQRGKAGPQRRQNHGFVEIAEDGVIENILAAEFGESSATLIDERAEDLDHFALGTGKLDDNGKVIPFNVKKGDTVLMPKYGGTEVKMGGKEYQIMREEDILAVIG